MHNNVNLKIDYKELQLKDKVLGAHANGNQKRRQTESNVNNKMDKYNSEQSSRLNEASITLQRDMDYKHSQMLTLNEEIKAKAEKIRQGKKKLKIKVNENDNVTKGKLSTHDTEILNVNESLKNKEINL